MLPTSKLDLGIVGCGKDEGSRLLFIILPGLVAMNYIFSVAVRFNRHWVNIKNYY